MWKSMGLKIYVLHEANTNTLLFHFFYRNKLNSRIFLTKHSWDDITTPWFGQWRKNPVAMTSMNNQSKIQ